MRNISSNIRPSYFILITDISMFFRFLILITLLLTYNLSYSYNFSDSTFKNYVWEYSSNSTYLIKNITFTAQAPLGTKENWWKNYESCEEASLMMSHFNINSITFDKYSADKEIDAMNYFQEFKIWTERNKLHNVESGKLYLRDITVNEIQDLAKTYYWYTDENSHVLNSPSVDTIKYLLSNDYIIIVPSYTKTLANPNFNLLTNSYHVIDLVWYDESNFIAFDPGTSRWAFYKYPFYNVLKWIQENWDDILILEWKINQNKVNFWGINEKIVIDRKVNLVYARINKILDNNEKTQELALRKILVNLKKPKINSVEDENSKLLSALTVKLDEKLKLIIEKKWTVTYLSDRLRKHFEK